MIQQYIPGRIIIGLFALISVPFSLFAQAQTDALLDREFEFASGLIHILKMPDIAEKIMDQVEVAHPEVKERAQVIRAEALIARRRFPQAEEIVSSMPRNNPRAQAIMLALYTRERTGKGQWVHTSLIEAQIFMLDFQASRWLMKGEVPKQAGNDHPTSIPTGVFPTSDGYINIAAAGDKMWKRAALALGAQALIDHPEHATPALRSQNRKALNERLAEVTKTNTSAHWIESLNKAGVPCGPINTIDKTFAEPQVQHLGIARPVDHPALGEIKVVGQPINLSDYPQPKTLNPTPDLGQHTDEVLTGLGYDARTIADLKAGGAV